MKTFRDKIIRFKLKIKIRHLNKSKGRLQLTQKENHLQERNLKSYSKLKEVDLRHSALKETQTPEVK